MNTMDQESGREIELLHKDLTDKIISCYYKVYNKLGYGFLEKVYENALHHELLLHGHKVERQYPIKVYYFDIHVGEYFADLIIDDIVIIELKASSALVNDHLLQLQNYLKATDKEVGLLLNFGLKPEIRRKSFMNVDKSEIKQFNPNNPINLVHL